MCPTLFIDALNGKYNDESRWISHEDFSRLKDTDPYVAIVWSFGNNMRNYLYSREIEPLKKAIHYAIFFSDYSLGKELGYDLSFIDHIPDLQKRYIAVKHYFSKHDNIHQVSFDDAGGAEKVETAGIIQPGYTTRINADMEQFCGYRQQKQWCASTPICRIGGAKNDLRRLDSMERSSALRSCNTWNVSTESRNPKKKSKWGALQLRATKHSCNACNTENGSTDCPDIRGGANLAHHVLCA